MKQFLEESRIVQCCVRGSLLPAVILSPSAVSAVVSCDASRGIVRGGRVQIGLFVGLPLVYLIATASSLTVQQASLSLFTQPVF